MLVNGVRRTLKVNLKSGGCGVSDRITAALDQIEAEQQQEPVPEGITALPLLQMAYPCRWLIVDRSS
jgi:hypothetical protein